jgi:ubiquinone/menaquinone biosynthesis C-methylase UbiE
MRLKATAKSMRCLAVLAIWSALCIAQIRDGLTLPQEVRLNERQPPEFVLKTIGIRPGMVIGEVGAGRGRYTVQIASRIGSGGRIYANDIDRDALDFLRRRCTGLGIGNVEIVTGTMTETGFPEKVMDLVVMVNVVHCLAEPAALLKNVATSLKPDGEIAIVEGNLDKDPSAAGEWFSRARLMGIFEAAGFFLVREDASLPRDNIYLLKKRTP